MKYMFKISAIDEWVKRIDAIVPEPVKELDHDFQEKIREFLMSFAKEMNLATREEFDVQTKVLLKTRMRLEELESRLKELEEKHSPTS